MSSFDEILVREVAKRPNIFDTKHKSYKNNIIRNKLWCEILTELQICGFPNVDLTKCQNRWKALRCKYKKIKQKAKTDKVKQNRAAVQENWRLESQLSFLDPILTGDTESSTTQIKIVNVNENASWSPDREVSPQPSESLLLKVDMKYQNEESSSSSDIKFIESYPTEITSQSLNTFDDPLINQLLMEKPDSVEMYCLSLVPSFTRMTERQLDVIKLEIQKFIVEYSDF